MFKDTRQLLSDAKFYEGYSRYNDEKQRYETWEEAVDRVMDMHRGYYADKLTPELEEAISFATRIYKDKGVLGAQRALQFGGDQILKHQMKIYNCLHQETKFLTKNGIKSFKDFEYGGHTEVMTHTGVWKNAIVKSYGAQSLYKIVLNKKTSEKTVIATKDHRWLLADETETHELKVGDRLLKEPEVFSAFDWEDSCTLEQLYWCYGFVYGDGTISYDKGNPSSRVRLCGRKAALAQRFTDLGFKSSTSASLEGDVIIYTGKYLKTLPDHNKDTPELIRAFVAGYLAADGSVNYNEGGKKYTGIQASNIEAINFIRNCFPIAGVHIISETDLTGQETNYGIRPKTIWFSTSDSAGSKYNSGWKVKSIDYLKDDTVWCLEVEDDHSFILDGGIVTGNCTSSYADRPEFFGEIFYIALCGCGAGFSVQGHHIGKLPAIAARTKSPKIHVVEDSIEGWADALDALMASYFEESPKFSEYRGHRVYFDMTKIRPKGAKISGGFKAPGPDPLRIALDRIEYILQGISLKNKRTMLRPIHVYDIVMHAMDSVIAGGVRRSATICLFSPDDEEMMNAKTDDWFQTNPQRARSNNSALLVRSQITKEKFAELFERTRQFGEPGFIFTEDLETCFNPCVEIGMYPQLDGVTGWQGCNLSEINGAQCDTEERFLELCHAASILCTLQAGYTDFKFLPSTSKTIFEREALIGVSITGWMANPSILFSERILRKGAKRVLEINKRIAGLLGINPAARTTCVKPSGNASVLLKTPSGIHPEHSQFYLRNIQISKDNEVANLMLTQNPWMIEESAWSASKNDYVISFPVVAKEGSLFKDEIKGVKHLELVKLAQQAWVESGTDEELCVNKTVRHNVSNTISVDDWDAVRDYVFKNRRYFAGISFISDRGDKDYFQAPNTKVQLAEDIVAQYGTGAVFASGLIVDANKIFDNLWLACATAQGTGENLATIDAENSLKLDWVRRFQKFSLNFFEGDNQKAEYCLKEVSLLHKWLKIQSTMVDIDWISELTEKKFIDIDTTGAAACTGVNERGEASCFI